MALKRLGVNFEHHRVIEIDKYAIASYNAVHGTNFEPTNICDVHAVDLEITDKDKYTYFLTYSYPCTSLSLAGKQEGMDRESGTASSLLWEVERILKECKELGTLPDVLQMENVTECHNYKNIDNFREWTDFLESLGYTNYLADMNAADYLVAQHRERSIMISILGDYNFKFPEPVEIDTCMDNYLEDIVDDRYYIKSQKAYDLIIKLVDDGVIPEDNALASKQASKQGNNYALMEQSMSLKSRQLQTALKQLAEESVNTKARKTLYLNQKMIDKVDPKLARTICARDWKGFGTSNQSMNGVIDCENKD